MSPSGPSSSRVAATLAGETASAAAPRYMRSQPATSATDTLRNLKLRLELGLDCRLRARHAPAACIHAGPPARPPARPGPAAHRSRRRRCHACRQVTAATLGGQAQPSTTTRSAAAWSAGRTRSAAARSAGRARCSSRFVAAQSGTPAARKSARLPASRSHSARRRARTTKARLRAHGASSGSRLTASARPRLPPAPPGQP